MSDELRKFLQVLVCEQIHEAWCDGVQKEMVGLGEMMKRAERVVARFEKGSS